MTPTEKDIISEAVVLMDAARKNASSLLDVMRDDIIASRVKAMEGLVTIRRYLDDIHEMKKPIIKLLGKKEV